METEDYGLSSWLSQSSPHSLGKLIEWKHQGIYYYRNFTVPCPHSLGKLIEWKLHHVVKLLSLSSGPHSLGKLIEWKPQTTVAVHSTVLQSPLAGETH